MPYSLVTVPNYVVFSPDLETASKNGIKLDYMDDCLIHYSVKPTDIENHAFNSYHHVPLLLNPDGSQWIHANSFFRKYLENGKNTKTVTSYAKTLRQYANYCQENGIDMLVSQSKLRSPLVIYKRHLFDRASSRELKLTTVKELLTRLVVFYRFLVEDYGIQFKVMPWGSDKKGIALITKGDWSTIKEYTTSEVQTVRGAVRKTSEEKTFEGCVNDGGEQLRPLDERELKIVFNALREINNPEMTLVHSIILATGARTQTILTLRQCHFEYDPSDNELEVEIVAGNHSLIDSKFANRFVIRMPVILYRKIQLYIQCERAQHRYENASHQFYIPKEQYVFISKNGNPFFMSMTDPNLTKYKTPPNGAALTQFTSAVLKPKLKELGFDNPAKRYKFHNLRATFGLAKLNAELSAMPSDLPENQRGQFIDKAITKTMRYMNHKSRETTLHYLKLQENTKIVKTVQSEWERHLSNSIGCSL